jgi:hypothetical protein
MEKKIILDARKKKILYANNAFVDSKGVDNDSFVIYFLTGDDELVGSPVGMSSVLAGKLSKLLKDNK